MYLRVNPSRTEEGRASRRRLMGSKACARQSALSLAGDSRNHHSRAATGGRSVTTQDEEVRMLRLPRFPGH